MEEVEKDTRQIIIEASRSLFARYGFRKTTMEEIASAAHMGKSSIYHYFKSKEDVFRSVIRQEEDILKEQISKAVKSQKLPQDKLRIYVKTRVQVLNQLANYYSAFKDEYLEQYSFIQDLRKEADEYEFETIKSVLKEGVDRGIFVINDLELTVYAIVTAMKGLEYPWAIERDVSKIEKSIDSLFGILFHGIVKE